MRSPRALALPLVVFALAPLLVPWAGAPARADDPPDPARPPGGKPLRVHALVNARVITRPGEELKRATLVIRDGRIESVGEDLAVPPDARVWDCTGLTVYPGLVEPYLCPEDVPPPPGDDERPAPAGPPPAGSGAGHWSPDVRPERAMADEMRLEPDALRDLRKSGFTSAVLAPGKGIFRGTSALVNLRDGTPRQQLLRGDVAEHVALVTASRPGGYPSSLMGSVALVRQTLLDAEQDAAAWAAWEAAPDQERPEGNRALQALRPVLTGERPVCVQAEDLAALLRTTKLLGEFDLVPWVVLGDLDVYRWPDALHATAAPLIVSLNFPPVPEWDDPDEALEVETARLHHWWLAPGSPARLEQDQLRFSFTAHGLVDRASWRARAREAIARGLSEEAALAAVTTGPAALVGMPQLGIVAPGAFANLTICDGPLFDAESRVVEVWVDGERYPSELAPPTPEQLAGRWALDMVLDEETTHRFALQLGWEQGALTAAVDTRGLPAGAAPPALPAPVYHDDQLELTLPGTVAGTADVARVVATVMGRRLVGRFRAGDQAGRTLGLLRPAEPERKDEEPAPRPANVLSWPAWPPLPEPAPGAVLVRGATLWTEGPQGTFVGDLLCVGDTIAAVGTALSAPDGALVVDGRGLHVTPGLIDCHNHSFIEGWVNEATRSCTAEVRIADVIDASTVRVYQHLAGGTTCANVLHGSANAIGGQNAVVKLRWGDSPEGLLFAEAPPGIKWALGENPKRSNWGENLSPRYPTTRMGVVESIRERLVAARDYQADLEAWQRNPRPDRIPPRIDLQLQALVEVLRGERLVHCHSYRADEILAVIRLAEQMGFTVATFQHVLEGYKVADELAAHGAGASTFSDWWAYKIEVYDAIAYNAALMTRRGVLVSVNSDSSELARRLNQEAAKSLRWGGLSEDECLALVTINPARQLGIASRVGSLEPGKQADFAVWSAPPLSMRARCQETWIEGRRCFERQRDEAAQALGQTERAALLEAARAARWGKEPRRIADWRPTFGSQSRRHDEHEQPACCHEEGR